MSTPAEISELFRELLSEALEEDKTSRTVLGAERIELITRAAVCWGANMECEMPDGYNLWYQVEGDRSGERV